MNVSTAPPKAKVTASLEIIVSYDFLNTNSELVKNIRDTVVGKGRRESETFINNQEEISEATISLWPPWSPHLPTIPENIKIQVIE